MFEDTDRLRVEITFVATPPSRQLERASGVTDVRVDDRTVHCVVHGSFQPLLDAVRGYEVLRLTTCPESDDYAQPPQLSGVSGEEGRL
jgi:hypothetical protein